MWQHKNRPKEFADSSRSHFRPQVQIVEGCIFGTAIVTDQHRQYKRVHAARYPRGTLV